MPGRRHATTTTREDIPSTSNAPSSRSGSHLSKAQRILGTDNDLNIDSPIREVMGDYSWRHVGSRSSGMSISISESTQSTGENGSVHESDNEQWDRESGVFPNANRLHGKPSSTILGQQFGDDRATATSSASTRLRHNDSSSTLKSYYDRQKSPLSISQQTSASSARDLALRKGFPPILQRSPLLNVESAVFEDNFIEKGVYTKEEETTPEKMRKKPARLDLSRLFPRSRNHGDKSPADSTSSNASPSSMSTNNSRTSSQPPETGRRKLRKALSKESIQSQKNSVRTTHSHDPQNHETSGTLNNHYEHLPVRTPRMDQIPEASVPERLAARAKKDGHGYSKLDAPSKSPSTSENNREESQPFSWKNVRSSMMTSPYDNSSAASISSRNTKTSRTPSILSQSDLKDKSVLSLSSDSEGDFSDPEPEPVRSPSVASKNNLRVQQVPNRTSHRPTEHRLQSSNQAGGLTARTQGQRNGTGKEISSSLLQIPEAAPRTARYSAANEPAQPENYAPHPTRTQQKEYRERHVQKEKRTSRQQLQPSSIKIGRSQSHHQPTPPLSPSSMEFRQSSERESRFMAVTKQEEALLEALRQKRARMREEIIEEHETKKTPSPPRIPERSASQYSSNSSLNTVRGAGTASGKQRVLMYLDTPLSMSQPIDTSEPSPDLSDFLSFGSDDNSTPRNSWAPSRNGNGKARPDSFVSPYSNGDKFSPATPPSAARLSAVGGAAGLGSKKRNTGAVRFVDDSKAHAQEFLLDESESGVIWGM